MRNIEEIFKLKIKPKEKVNLLAEKLQKEKDLLNEMLGFYKTAKDPEKGTCLSALTLITKNKPEFVENCIDFIIGEISYKAPRVKWESSEIIANISSKYPDKVEKAIPKLIGNIKDGGTVVRWSAAYGLTEIAKGNPKKREELIQLFKKMIKEEKQNGVRNVYLKALKKLGIEE